jgi:hypothetical protein
MPVLAAAVSRQEAVPLRVLGRLKDREADFILSDQRSLSNKIRLEGTWWMRLRPKASWLQKGEDASTRVAVLMSNAAKLRPAAAAHRTKIPECIETTAVTAGQEMATRRAYNTGGNRNSCSYGSRSLQKNGGGAGAGFIFSCAFPKQKPFVR